MSERVRQALSEREMALGPAVRRNRGRRHWRLGHDENGVAWLVLDRLRESANTLNEEVLEELEGILSRLAESPPKGLVLRSAKPSGFCAGADIRAFTADGEPGELAHRLRQAHHVIDRLAGLACPTVAVIHGHCLGGGLELALACDRRIALPDASLGFPEVMLGLHPGLGGTMRTPRLIDPVQAMTMMLTGKPVRAGKAKRLGLVDAVTEERHVDNAVADALGGRLKRRRRGLKSQAMATALMRRTIAKRMRTETAKRASELHYPAPFALIDLWEAHGGDRAAMQRAELDSFVRLLSTDTAQNLIRAFFLREGLKARADAKERDRVSHVHVVGAGSMGGDIAGWCALKGLTVTLSDIDPALIGKAVARTRDLCRHRHRSKLETRDVLDRLIPDPAGDGVAKADLVIEAVPEKRAIKRQVYAQLEARMARDAVLATNTSSIPLETLREDLARPERLVGLHFFNPVARLELVELVHHDAASERAMARARAFLGQIDRLPAPVKSAPGFLVNRALMPMLGEAMLLLEEGVAAPSVDKAAERFGLPLGPIEMADRVGLDICVDVADMLAERLEIDMPEMPARLREMVAAGDLGRKTGRGFYRWSEKGPEKGEAGFSDETMTDRLVLPLLNACMTCLREGVVEDEDIVDAAMIFATGFAPFRGGPMRYARARGFEEVKAALERLAEAHGPRFAPDPGWSEQA